MKWFMKSINCYKQGYTSITCSKISKIAYNIIFTTIFNDSSILITIISCDYLNLSLSNEYADDVTIPTQVIKYSNNFLQADQPIRLQFWNQINYMSMFWKWNNITFVRVEILCVFKKKPLSNSSSALWLHDKRDNSCYKVNRNRTSDVIRQKGSSYFRFLQLNIICADVYIAMTTP